MLEQIQIKVSDCEKVHEHFHMDIELMYMIEGNMRLSIEGKEYKLQKEDIIVINQNRKHFFSTDQWSLYCVLPISYQLFSEILKQSDFLIWCNSSVEYNDAYNELRIVLKKILNRHIRSIDNHISFGEIGLYYSLMEILSKYFIVSSKNRMNFEEENRNSKRINFINDYIRSKYNQSISLKDLAKQLFLSDAYLSRYFSKNYGMTFTEYLNNVRLFHALDELLSTDQSITRIALNNGFSTSALFNKAFKKMYGETPSEFRANKKPIKKVETQVLSNEIHSKLEKFLNDDNTYAVENQIKNQVCAEYSVNQYQQYEKNWNQMINVGTSTDLLEADMQEHVLILKERFHFKYIRIWNLFSENLIMTQNNEKHNFRKLDYMLDFLVEHNLKPFLEFGQKPKAIINNLKSVRVQKNKYFDMGIAEWKSVIDAFMKHVIYRYGNSEVATWKIEVWDGGQEANREETKRIEYFSFFQACYSIIKKHLPELEVGGCGSTAVFDSELFIRDLKLWTKYAQLPDFFSVMIYGYIKGESAEKFHAKRTTDPNFLSHSLDEIWNIFEQEKFPVKRLYVTEWSQSLSDRNFINDSCFQGAYYMNSLIQCIGKAEILGYHHGSDRFSDHYDTADILYGGRGLLTKNGIIKPSGYAFIFMNLLYDYYIEKATNYFITTNQDYSYGIVCHNCRTLNYYYNLTKEDEISCEKIWQYYEDSESLELNIVLNDVKNAIYQLKILRVNEKHGSVMGQWKEMGYCDDSSKEITRYIKHNSEPVMSIKKMAVTNNKLQIRINLLANEIAYIGIKKLELGI